jgi:hypothetical protein
VKRGGESRGIPLEAGDRVNWSLRFEVEVNDDKFPFGKKIPAQLSVASGDRLWSFGDMEAESTRISARTHLVNFGFERGKKGENFIGPGAEEIWTTTFRIHGSAEMVFGDTGRALSNPQFDLGSGRRPPFIALGYGDETYLWIELLSLNEGSKGIDTKATAGLAKSLRYTPPIRIGSDRDGEDAAGKRLLLEYRVDPDWYGAGSGPVLETSTDLKNWVQPEKKSYTHEIVENEDGTESHQYELILERSEGEKEPERRFFRVRSR